MKGIVASTAGLVDPAGGGDRGHDPGLAHARAGRRARGGGAGRAAGAAVDGPALVPAPGQRLPGLRPHHLDVLPGDGRAHPGPPARPDARVEGALPGRRGDDRRGHGLRRERPGRIEARRHRHLPAGHVRGAGRTRVHRRHGSIGRSAARASSTSSSTSSRATSTGATPAAGAAAWPRGTAARSAEARDAGGRSTCRTGPVYTLAERQRPPRNVGDPHVFFRRRSVGRFGEEDGRHESRFRRRPPPAQRGEAGLPRAAHPDGRGGDRRRLPARRERRGHPRPDRRRHRPRSASTAPASPRPIRSTRTSS